MQTNARNFNRRCFGHDYRSRCIYMITMLKSPYAPIFSTITAREDYAKVTPHLTLHPAGRLIYRCLDELSANNLSLKILIRAAMPDHIHFELFVTESISLPLGSIIASFKSNCTRQFWDQFPASELARKRLPLFTPGFNDKIAFKAGAKDAFYNYISDNPRRYLVKKLFSDYFYHKLVISINGLTCGLYGNIFLIDNPVKSAVRISREPHKTPDYDKKQKEWNETIRSGGVLVSPFINPAEKVFRDKAIENGCGLIIIIDYKFSERAKPYKSLFDLCAEGKLLIVSTEEFNSPQKSMRYTQARKLNDLAAAIESSAPGTIKLLPRTGNNNNQKRTWHME